MGVQPSLERKGLPMDDKELGKLALQKLLDYQMPTGEWGYFSTEFADRYERVGETYWARTEYLPLIRKPNGYRTVTGMEMLRDYCGSAFNSRIRRAVGWLKRNLSSGWFMGWDAFVTGSDPYRDDRPHLEKAPDVRHTAQALLGLLKFDRNPGDELVRGLRNILNSQLENGMWPRKPGSNHVEIFRSVCCADLLFHVLDRRYTPKLSKLGVRNSSLQKVRIALDRTCAWLVDCAKRHNGLWEDEYKTAMVLERLGHRLLHDKRYVAVAESAVAALLERMTDQGWTNSSIADAQTRYDDQKRYECTIRICASLFAIRGTRLWIPDETLKSVTEHLRDGFEPKKIDASDYRYFLQIFCGDRDAFRSSVQREDFFDYLDLKRSDSVSIYSDGAFLAHVMSLWVMDCLGRLARLAEGKVLGLPNYDQAYLEREEELLTILQSMRLVSKDQPTARLPSWLLECDQTGDLRSLWRDLERLLDRYHVEIQRTPDRGAKIYQEVKDVVSTIAAKFLAEMSKP